MYTYTHIPVADLHKLVSNGIIRKQHVHTLHTLWESNMAAAKCWIYQYTFIYIPLQPPISRLTKSSPIISRPIFNIAHDTCTPS